MSYPLPLAPSGSRDSAFGAFAAAAFGFALLQTACILLAAQAAVHLATVVAGAALVAVTLRRFLHHWPARPGGMRTTPTPGALWRIVPAALAGGVACFAALSLSYGVVTPFILFALALVLLPWTRLAETRAHCLGYAGAAAGGIAAGLLASGLRFHPMLLLAVAWMLGLCAILSWLRLVLDEKKAGRRVAAW